MADVTTTINAQKKSAIDSNGQLPIGFNHERSYIASLPVVIAGIPKGRDTAAWVPNTIPRGNIIKNWRLDSGGKILSTPVSTSIATTRTSNACTRKVEKRYILLLAPNLSAIRPAIKEPSQKDRRAIMERPG